MLIVERLWCRVLVVGRLAAPHGAEGLDGGAARGDLRHADVGGGGGAVEDLCGGAQVRLPVLVRERGGRRRGGRRRRRTH